MARPRKTDSIPPSSELAGLLSVCCMFAGGRTLVSKGTLCSRDELSMASWSSTALTECIEEETSSSRMNTVDEASMLAASEVDIVKIFFWVRGGFHADLFVRWVVVCVLGRVMTSPDTWTPMQLRLIFNQVWPEKHFLFQRTFSQTTVTLKQSNHRPFGVLRNPCLTAVATLRLGSTM